MFMDPNMDAGYHNGRVPCDKHPQEQIRVFRDPQGGIEAPELPEQSSWHTHPKAATDGHESLESAILAEARLTEQCSVRKYALHASPGEARRARCRPPGRKRALEVIWEEFVVVVEKGDPWSSGGSDAGVSGRRRSFGRASGEDSKSRIRR